MKEDGYASNFSDLEARERRAETQSQEEVQITRTLEEEVIISKVP